MSALDSLSLLKHTTQLLQTPQLATLPDLLDFHRQLESSEEQIQQFRARSIENSAHSEEKHLQLITETIERLSSCLKRYESTPGFGEVKNDYLQLQASYEREKAELNQKREKNHQLLAKQGVIESRGAEPPSTLSPQPPVHSDRENVEVRKEPLKPLSENPLQRSHPLGFALGISELDPYHRQYPEWCEAVQLTFPRILDAPSYREVLRSCKIKMGLEKAERGVPPIQKGYLENIVRVLNTLIDNFSQPKPDLRVIPTAITTIYENIYLLLVSPISEVYHYIQHPLHLYTRNQFTFRQELEQCLPPGETTPEDFINPLLNSLPSQELESVSLQLQIKHPNCKKTIQALTLKALLLIDKMKQAAQKEIDLYREKPEIKFCFDSIFQRCSYLAEKYDSMKQGRYESLAELPTEPSDKVYEASYTPHITGLLRVCETFRNSTEPNRFEIFKAECEKYITQQKSREHFQTLVVPLIGFLQCIKNILLWPQQYELAPGEIKYINSNLYFLIGISGKSIAGIPYKYLSISEEDKKNAEAVLKKKDSPLQKKREASRTLLHARIPWASLQALGCLLHKSGGVSETEAVFNQALVTASLIDLIPNLPAVKQSIEELVEFELTECSPAPSIVQPAKLPEGCYAYIQLLGNISEIQRSIKKTLEILRSWRNRPLMADDFKTPKIRYAALRTIQILGELSKNLREAGILSADASWDNLEELRDLLSHSERISLFKRLKIWIDQPEGKYIAGFFEDFRTLGEYFQDRLAVLNQAKTWADRKRLHQKGKERPANLELNGLQDLYIFLAAKITQEQQLALRETLKKAEAVKAREEIARIKEEFLQNKFDPQTYQAKIAKLPLAKGQQKLLEEAIKIMMNPKAAANNQRSAKPGMLKKTVQIMGEFKKSKKFADSIGLLEDLSKLLSRRNYFNNPEDPEIMTEDQLVEDKTFPKRIARAEEILTQLRLHWSEKAILPPQLEIAEDYLRNLQEEANEFIERKKQACQEIVEAIPTYPPASLQEESDNLIRALQIEIMPLEKLKLAIKGLGVCGPDEKAWEAAHAGCIKKKEAANPHEKESKENPTDIAKKKALNCIEAIIDRIQKLDRLISCQSRDQEYKNLNQDMLLQLACQYLVSDFRASASSLELYIETLKYSFPLFRPFFSEIQQSLINNVKTGNDFLHVHEVTEPSTLTSAGHVFEMHRLLLELLKTFSLGKNHDIIMDSFRQKLNRLKDILSNKNI